MGRAVIQSQRLNHVNAVLQNFCARLCSVVASQQDPGAARSALRLSHGDLGKACDLVEADEASLGYEVAVVQCLEFSTQPP